MRLLYSLLLTVLAILLLPYFLWQGLVKGKYLGNLAARLGLARTGNFRAGRPGVGPVIWLHAVSVGETLASRPLCRELKRRHPGARLFLTTTTATGQAVAKAQVPEADLVGYYPFDWMFAVRRMLDRIEPELVILMESELWLNFLSECRARAIPVVVVNGRISDRSFPRSRRLKFLVGRLYRLVTCLVMQSGEDAARAIALGAPPARVVVGGNLKYDIGAGGSAPDPGRSSAPLADLRRLTGSAEGPLIIAGSTHPGEEEIVIGAFRELRDSGAAPGVRLLIAPRHPERFNEVAERIGAAGLRLGRRSEMGEGSGTAEALLLDSIGELALAYELGTVVLVGGSLKPIGGHNILEPALAGRPIIVGPYMHNFREMTAEFRRAQALIQLAEGDDEELRRRLRESWEELLGDVAGARAMGERARRVVEANRGATARTAEVLDGILDGTWRVEA